jgi:phage tail protein X
MTTYVTKDGDTVDYIAWKHYGSTEQRAVEQVLDANPGLADRGPILPHSVRIELPELTPQPVQKGPRLWD